jgi:hypothetical protein
MFMVPYVLVMCIFDWMSNEMYMDLYVLFMSLYLLYIFRVLFTSRWTFNQICTNIDLQKDNDSDVFSLFNRIFKRLFMGFSTKTACVLLYSTLISFNVNWCMTCLPRDLLYSCRKFLVSWQLVLFRYILKSHCHMQDNKRGSVQCEKRQIGFQKFNHYLQHSQEWPDFPLVTRTGHAYHVMSLVCYNYRHEDSARNSINKRMTVVYEIISIRMTENFIIKLEELSSCTHNQLILKYF